MRLRKKRSYCHRLSHTVQYDCVRQTDTAVLSLEISPKPEGGQIHINVTSVLGSLTNSTDTKRGFVGAEVFYWEHALTYPHPQFYEMRWSHGHDI